MLRRIVSNQCVRGTIRNENGGPLESPKKNNAKSAIIIGLGLLALGAEYYVSNNTPKEFKRFNDDD